MEERCGFVLLAEKRQQSFSSLCAEYGVASFQAALRFSCLLTPGPLNWLTVFFASRLEVY